MNANKLPWILLLVAPMVFGQVHKTITVEHATEREDGTALSLAEIERVDVRCFRHGTDDEITALAIVPPNTSRATDAVFGEGDYICRAWTVDTMGQVSSEAADSNVFTVAHPCIEAPSLENCARPMAPRSIVITLGT